MDSQKIYFEFPSWQGNVYKIVTAIVSPSFVAVLPDGRGVMLECDHGFVMREKELSVEEVSAAYKNVNVGRPPVLRAELVFKKEEAVQEWKGSWDDHLIEMIEAAAAVNNLFVVHLPSEEYERLKLGGLEQLLSRFSENAVDRLRLSETSVIDFKQERPALDLLRVGSCHGCGF